MVQREVADRVARLARFSRLWPAFSDGADVRTGREAVYVAATGVLSPAGGLLHGSAPDHATQVFCAGCGPGAVSDLPPPVICAEAQNVGEQSSRCGLQLRADPVCLRRERHALAGTRRGAVPGGGNESVPRSRAISPACKRRPVEKGCLSFRKDSPDGSSASQLSWPTSRRRSRRSRSAVGSRSGGTRTRHAG